MKIDQPILKYKIEDIISSIEDFMQRKLNKNFKIFFPKNKNWFIDNLSLLKEICQNNKNIEKTLTYYKRDGYIMINSILYNNSFPLVYLYKNYKNANLFEPTKINSEPVYIFPKDINYIKNYEKTKYLNYIKNIDSLFIDNKKFLLDDCILFRGYQTNSKRNNNALPIGKDYMYQKYNNFIFNKNNKEITLKGYGSFSFNPQIASGFINTNGYFLILKVNKKDNIPGLFLPNIFFNNNIDYNSFLKQSRDEIEILLPRNIKIKVIKKKEIKLSKIYPDNSIDNIYNNKNIKNKFNKIKIIYAETLPYTYEPFVPDNDGFKYMCI